MDWSSLARAIWVFGYQAVVMDEAHLYQAFAYVVTNPVRARLVKRAQDWPWSSIHAHLGKCNDGITRSEAANERVGDFARFLEQNFDEQSFAAIRGSEQIGRPVGSAAFVQELEEKFDRKLARQRPGPKLQKSQ